MTNQIIQPPPRGDRLQALAFALFGLLLGLFIGWVAWPVEWRDARLDDLRPELQAQYVAAVADAYAASGGQDAATALARLQGFSDPQAAIQQAIQLHQQSEDPKRNIRVVNLRKLAAALDATTSEQPLAANPPLAISPPQDIQTPTQAPGMSWLNWSLLVLAGLVLTGGGLWLGMRVLGRGQGIKQAFRSWTDRVQTFAQPMPQVDAAPPQTSRGGFSPVPSPPNPGLATGGRPSHPEPPVILEVDTDLAKFEEPIFAQTSENSPLSPPSPDAPVEEFERVLPVVHTGLKRPPDEESAAEGLDSPGAETAQNMSEVGEADNRRAQTTEQAPAPAEIQWDDSQGDNIRETMQGILSSFWRGRAPAQHPAEPVGVFVAEYHFGIPSYAQSFDVTQDGAEDAPLGACGMASNESLDKAAAHTDQVRLLEIWLYDAGDIRSYRQYIVAPGVDVDSLEDPKENSATVTHAPLVAEPGTEFKIRAKNLTLHCRLEHVELLRPGDPTSPFRRVRASFQVYTRSSGS